MGGGNGLEKYSDKQKGLGSIRQRYLKRLSGVAMVEKKNKVVSAGVIVDVVGVGISDIRHYSAIS